MDDSIVVRDRIVEILSEVPGVNRVLQAGDTQSAVELISKYQPPIIILDIQVPGTAEMRNGIDVLKWTRSHFVQSQIIMLSNFDIPRYRDACMAAGAYRFFDKSSDFEQLPVVIADLLSGSTAIEINNIL